jgi:hypothetical protein
MSSLWPHSHESLADSLSLFAASLKRLKAVQPVDSAEVTQQFLAAEEACQNLRSLVGSALPGSTWRTREEYEALLVRIEGILGARSRLMALVQELEGGRIMHRRAMRVDQLNQLRAQAIMELRSHAESEGEPPILSGPEVEKWIDWACSLKEPEDSAALEALHTGFPRLDAFVADLEPGMWVVNTPSTV